jgi:hypothetical protein
MRSTLILVLTALLLGACASEPTTWVKMDGHAETWPKDRYECERDARMSAASFGTGLVASRRAQQFFDQCLRAKGYLPAKLNPDGSPR